MTKHRSRHDWRHTDIMIGMSARRARLYRSVLTCDRCQKTIDVYRLNKSDPWDVAPQMPCKEANS